MKQIWKRIRRRENGTGSFRTNLKFLGVIMPVVLVMIFIFFLLTQRKILDLSQDRLTLKSENYAENISAWTEQTLSELNLYKGMVEQIGLEDDRAYDILTTSYDTHDAYPLGLYMGDENGNYFDASGWVPDEDFVVTEREWYLEGLEHEQFAFGEPYLDALTGNTCVSATAKLYRGSVVCVLAADVYLDYAAELSDRLAAEDIVDIAFFVEEESRMILADSDKTKVGTGLGDEENPLLYRNINKLLEEKKIGTNKTWGEHDVYYVSINPIENNDWYFITCVRERAVLQELRNIQWVMILVAAVATGILLVMTLRLAKEMGQISTKAKTDPLTGLLNRFGFREMTQLALATNTEQGALMIFDLDNFKLINDRFGHPEGDAVLKQFSGLLEKFFNRNKDIVARIGGDEFAVYVGREVSRDDVNEMLRKFTDIVHKTFDEKYPEQKLSASIGAAFTAEHKVYQELYQKADQALYEVKNKGKDGFAIS